MKKGILIKRFSIAFVSILLTIPVFGANKDLGKDITMVSYEQSVLDYEGVVALKNNTDEEIKSVSFRLIYLDMDGNELDYHDFTEYVNIAPGMTKKVKVEAYEEFRNYYYYKSKDEVLTPDSYTPFDVKFQLIDYNNQLIDFNNDSTSGIPPVIIFFFLGVIGIIIGIALVVLVGILAKKRNRDPLLWVVLCFIFTPLVILIVLLCMGKKENSKW